MSELEMVTPATKKINPEFGFWNMDEGQRNAVNVIRQGFDSLLDRISPRIPAHNARYLAMVKVRLETACMLAIKGVAKPERD